MEWQWYQNPKTNQWYRIIDQDWLLSNRIGQDGGRGYQVQLTDWVKKYFADRKTQRAIDIGAHIGITAIEYAKIFDQVEAFEPVPDLYHQLLMTVDRNQIANVQSYCLGCSNQPGTAAMKYKPNNTFATQRSPQGNIQSKFVTIDSFDFDPVDFIKIDVEGMESQVIDGAWQTIKKHQPVIQFEYKKNLLHKQSHDHIGINWIIEALESIGYQIQDRFGHSYQTTKQKDLFAVCH
jgi:FkbM family methyltransferase